MGAQLASINHMKAKPAQGVTDARNLAVAGGWDGGRGRHRPLSLGFLLAALWECWNFRGPWQLGVLNGCQNPKVGQPYTQQGPAGNPILRPTYPWTLASHCPPLIPFGLTICLAAADFYEPPKTGRRPLPLPLGGRKAVRSARLPSPCWWFFSQPAVSFLPAGAPSLPPPPGRPSFSRHCYGKAYARGIDTNCNMH